MSKNSKSAKYIIGGAVILGVLAMSGASNNKANNSIPSNNQIQQTVDSTQQPKVKSVETRKCQQDVEKSRVCSACNVATITYSNLDCTTYIEKADDNTCSSLCPPKCIQDEEVSRTCSGCNIATVTYKNLDCSQATKEIQDRTCTSGCPVKQESPVPPQFTCNCSKTCTQITSCAEAQYQLNVCGCGRRDGDNDGIACDDMCQ